jgi:putative NADH-flavin reductase
MKILVLGANGGVGTDVTAELISRGHQVTAASRTGGTASADGITPITLDATSADAVAQAAAGHDAIVNAVGPRFGQDDLAGLSSIATAVVTAARQSRVTRVVIVGGAGTLEVAPGVRLVDTENMPDEYKPLAHAHADAFDIYRTAGDLEWTYLTPPPEFMPGDRTGTYRAEGDSYLAGEDGRSRLSYADMAVAVADTIEQGTHKGARVAVAY